MAGFPADGTRRAARAMRVFLVRFIPRTMEAPRDPGYAPLFFGALMPGLRIPLAFTLCIAPFPDGNPGYTCTEAMLPGEYSRPHSTTPALCDTHLTPYRIPALSLPMPLP